MIDQLGPANDGEGNAESHTLTATGNERNDTRTAGVSKPMSQVPFTAWTV